MDKESSNINIQINKLLKGEITWGEFTSKVEINDIELKRPEVSMKEHSGVNEKIRVYEVIRDMPKWISDIDGKIYGPYFKGDLLGLPENIFNKISYQEYVKKVDEG